MESELKMEGGRGDMGFLREATNLPVSENMQSIR